MKSLVIGIGEIGSAIAEILECDGINSHTEAKGDYDVIHICFPYSDKFIEQVKDYQKMYSPIMTIIHSTVPMGTSEQLGAVHSPVRGVHPLLKEGIMTFVKYFGGANSYDAARIFADKGIAVHMYDESKTTEALKLIDTTQYGLMIMIQKEIYNFCQDQGLDFDVVYRSANIDYNKGYVKLGREDVVRPFLTHMPGGIGGHCVIPNAHILKEDFWLAKLLLDKNDVYELDQENS